MSTKNQKFGLIVFAGLLIVLAAIGGVFVISLSGSAEDSGLDTGIQSSDSVGQPPANAIANPAPISNGSVREPVDSDGVDFEESRSQDLSVPTAMPTAITDNSERDEMPASTMAAIAGPSAEPTQVAVQSVDAQEAFLAEHGVNPIVDTSMDNLSTFALDVDTASYAIARNSIERGYLPGEQSVRPEEFINYFETDYPAPDGAFGISVDGAPAPFAEADNTTLLRVGIQGRYIPAEERDPTLLIFVLDVSGSMNVPNRLPLAKETLHVLINELREDDRIALVVYSQDTRVVLEPTPASEADTIKAAINTLSTEGSTNLQAGLDLGYTVANQYKQDGELTRVILLSDGMANQGITQAEAIIEQARVQAEGGVTLSTIGFGLGSYNDSLMERIANETDGNYYYVDNIREARRVFVHQLTGTLQVIGFDARIQVEFNANAVSSYRLIGYENRAVADEDFRNDEIDAAEVGAGHSVTALYEVVISDDTQPLGTVFVRYQNADTQEFEEINRTITADDLMPSFDDTPVSFRLHATSAEFAELLRGSFFAQAGDYLTLWEAVARLPDSSDSIVEFKNLVLSAGRIADTAAR